MGEVLVGIGIWIYGEEACELTLESGYKVYESASHINTHQKASFT